MIKFLKNMLKGKESISEDRPYKNIPSLKLVELLKTGDIEMHDGHTIVNELLERLIRKEDDTNPPS